MSYSVYNEDGWLGQLATVSGYHDLVETVKDGGPVARFLKLGHSAEASEVSSDATELSASAALPSSVRATLRNLAALASKSGGFLLVSDSAHDEPEELGEQAAERED